MPCPCHLENPRKSPCARRSGRLVFSSVLLFFVALGLAKDAIAFTQIAASPKSLSFGSVTVGTSHSLSEKLTNDGNRSVTLSQATLTGAGFSVSGLVLPIALGPRGSTTFTVVFAPKVSGSVPGHISITSTGTALSISLSGTGAASPAASLSPSSLPFASQGLGTTSSAQVVTLTNSGGTTLSITGIALTGANAGDFAQTNTCGNSVAAGAKCTISATFTPSATGTRSGTLSISDNAAGSPQTVTLTGTCGNPAPTLTSLLPSSAAAGAPAQTLTLSGANFLSTSTVTYNGVGHTPTFLSATQMTISLSAGDQATAGIYPVALTNPGPGGGASNSLNFTVTAPIAGFSPASFTFPNQPASTSSSGETFTLSNTGNGALSITNIGFTGTNPGDFSQNTTCGATLAANATCTVVVVFTPTATGTRTGSLVVTDNTNDVAGSTQIVTLTGTCIHDVVLSWTDSPSGGIAGYDIFRGTTSGGENTTPLNSTPVSSATYVDTNVTPGSTYYYVVTAVASNGTQSPASNEASGAVPTQ